SISLQLAGRCAAGHSTTHPSACAPRSGATTRPRARTWASGSRVSASPPPWAVDALILCRAARSAAATHVYFVHLYDFLCICIDILDTSCRFVYDVCIVVCSCVHGVEGAMQLSLQEAVQILGKTRRQVLYMI